MLVGGCGVTSRGRTLQGVTNPMASGRCLERPTKERDSRVRKSHRTPSYIQSTTGHEKSRGKPGGPPSKTKYSERPIVNQYREGKVKSTPTRGVKEHLKLDAYKQWEAAMLTTYLLYYGSAT